MDDTISMAHLSQYSKKNMCQMSQNYPILEETLVEQKAGLKLTINSDMTIYIILGEACSIFCISGVQHGNILYLQYFVSSCVLEVRNLPMLCWGSEGYGFSEGGPGCSYELNIKQIGNEKTLATARSCHRPQPWLS